MNSSVLANFESVDNTPKFTIQTFGFPQKERRCLLIKSKIIIIIIIIIMIIIIVIIVINVSLVHSTSERQLGFFLIVSLSESSSETCTVLSAYKR